MATTKQPAVGIDLGTTFSVAACIDSAGQPSTVSNAEGDLTTPSVVFFDDADIIVGREAAKALVNPERAALGVKREMGKPVFSHPIAGEFYPPEVIQSLVLEKVKKDTSAKIGDVLDVVVTVPAYFDEPRRKATQDAGRLAGLNVVDIINEPTAAAIAYGVRTGFLDERGESKRLERVVVYDLGGGTFDATLMEIDGKNYRVLATDGDVYLGGLDWDRRIVDHCSQRFLAEHRVDPRSDPQSLQRLMRDAEDAKRTLSARSTAKIPVTAGGHSLSVELSRDEFDNLTADLLDRTRFTVSELVRLAGAKWEDVTRILLVGGSTRMPMVPEMLTREFGRPIDASLAVDEAVAHGAALYAGLLQMTPEAPFEPWAITNVNSHALGVLGVEPKTRRPRAKVIIPRNTPLPAVATKKFQTFKAGQRSVKVKIIEGGDASGHHATHIGRCIVRDLPPGLPAGTRVEVTFTYAANGRLSVHASLPSVGREARLDIERASGLSADQLDEWGQRIEEKRRPLNLDT